jgi:hypothetical protein
VRSLLFAVENRPRSLVWGTDYTDCHGPERDARQSGAFTGSGLGTTTAPQIRPISDIIYAFNGGLSLKLGFKLL